jgi:Holliday junction resolvase RusA-like endonuclease
MTPTPQGRSRSTKGGHHYTPEKTRLAAVDIKSQLLRGDIPLFKGPLELTAAFYFIRPKSVPQSKRPKHTVKPDLSNLVKLLEDSCNGLLWLDDCQIVSLILDKYYVEESHKNQRPRIELELVEC